jgi:hypothetical protein
MIATCKAKSVLRLANKSPVKNSEAIDPSL